MRKVLALMLALITVLSLTVSLPAAAEEDSEVVPVLELPEAKKGKFAELTTAENPMVAPKDKYYKGTGSSKTAESYQNPSITVNVGTGRVHGTAYMYVRVKIASAYQFRVAPVETALAKVTTMLGTKIASRVKAVVAVNGVLESDKTSSGVGARLTGPVLIQGEWMRPAPTTDEARINKWRAEEAQADALVIDDEGNLNIVSGETWGDIYDQIAAMGEHAMNAFCFGPAIVVNGEPVYGYYSRAISTAKRAQRMAICQTGPLEYLLITSEGPENPGSKGLQLDQFIELIATKFPEVQTAYNLDGGSSATIVFRKGNEKWAKINCPKGGKARPLRDIIYFADAWIPD